MTRRLVTPLLAVVTLGLAHPAAASVDDDAGPQGGEIVLGIGALTIAGDLDLQVSYRLADSGWEFGYRALRTKEVADDPFTGDTLTRSVERLRGPLVNYRFTPERPGSLYVGAGYYEWTRSHYSAVAVRSGEDTTRALFVGIGYAGRFTTHLVYNLGLYIAPQARLDTGADARREDDRFGADLAVQLGFAF